MSVVKTKREPIDLSKILARHANCWVVLSADEQRVVTHGKHPKVALTRAYARGEDGPILMWAPKEHRASIVGSFYREVVVQSHLRLTAKPKSCRGAHGVIYLL